MIHIGLFEGIGGFSLAANWIGWDTLVTSEINPFGQDILRYYWPNAYHHGDIHTLNYETINAELTKRHGSSWRNDEIIVTGGFPCQPYSLAGKRRGKEDARHLWPEMLRTIHEIAPTYIVGENVYGLVNWDGGLVFNEVQADLEAEGYEVLPVILPACSVNAPHRRERVWFVAYSNKCATRSPRTGTGIIGERCNNNNKPTEWREQTKQYNRYGNVYGVNPNTSNTGLQRSQDGRSSDKFRKEQKQHTPRFLQPNWDNFPTQSPIRSGNDGFPNQLDGITFPKWRNESIKAFGNAIVPQVAFQIFKAIQLHHNSILP